jgi:spore coat polysaccharide biosynthesis protein SpsF (cytidylyltransferase family)
MSLIVLLLEKRLPQSERSDAMVASLKAVAVIDLGDCERTEGADCVARYAQRNLKGQPLISRIARRISESAMVQNVVVSGVGVPSTILTSGIPGATVLNQPHSHVIERLALAADRTGSDWVVFLPGNRPFVDPVLVDRLLGEAKRHSECDYVGFFSTGGGWQRMQRLGLAGEICHADALRRLRRNIDRLSYCTEETSLASYFQDAPGSYQMRFIPVPAELDRGDLRFSVETESDWDDIQLLCDSISSEDTHWQRLATIVLGNPGLRAAMEDRNG